MIKHSDINRPALFRLVKRKEIQFAGNAKLKIYGKLNCWSGKRMKEENRVFFSSEAEAIQYGFRPCGHCMKTENSVRIRTSFTVNEQMVSSHSSKTV